MALRDAALTLAVALAGAGTATAAGLPAAALLGSTLAVAGMALLRLPARVPAALRGAAFAAIGVTLGAGITPSFLSDVARWPLSLAALAVSLGAGMALASVALVRLFGMDARTAVLATSPGALSYAVAMALEGRGDPRAVVVLQSVRLMAITLLLPPVIGTLGEGAPGRAAVSVAMSYPWALAVLAAAWALGGLGARVKVPAAHLLAGVALSGAAHAAGLTEGRLPGPLAMLGFAVAGGVIGARLAEVTLRELSAFGRAAAMVSALGIAVSAAASLAVAGLTGLPFGQVWVAFAPGGVESMAAMALALGYDPVYVAVHHVLRLLGLIAALPLVLRLLR